MDSKPDPAQLAQQQLRCTVSGTAPTLSHQDNLHFEPWGVFCVESPHPSSPCRGGAACTPCPTAGIFSGRDKNTISSLLITYAYSIQQQPVKRKAFFTRTNSNPTFASRLMFYGLRTSTCHVPMCTGTAFAIYKQEQLAQHG